MSGWIKRLKWCKECDPQTISYHLYFLRIPKVSRMFHHRSVGQIHSTDCYFLFTYIFLDLLLFFIRKLMFLSFSFLLLSEVSNKRILINQKPDLVIRNCQSNCLSAAKISKLPKLMDIKKVAFNYFANFTGKYLSLFN